MNEFAQAAARLAGLTGLLLGSRPGEFWATTPAEVAAVLGSVGEEPGTVSSGELERLRAQFPD